MILLYAVVPADAGARAAAAVAEVSVVADDGAAGAGVTDGGIALTYREIDSDPTADREEVLRFGRVLSVLAERTTVLPVRFGTVLPGPQQACELLRERGRGWRRRLNDLAGRVELIVHVGVDVPPAPAAGAPSTGGDYLRAKVAEHRRTSAQLDEVAAAVTPWCRAVRTLPSREAAEVRLACLVAVDEEADLRAALDTWAAAGKGRHGTVTGPFPVLSFTEDDVS